MEKGWELRTRIQKVDPHYFAVAGAPQTPAS